MFNSIVFKCNLNIVLRVRRNDNNNNNNNNNESGKRLQMSGIALSRYTMQLTKHNNSND